MQKRHIKPIIKKSIGILTALGMTITATATYSIAASYEKSYYAYDDDYKTDTINQAIITNGDGIYISTYDQSEANIESNANIISGGNSIGMLAHDSSYAEFKQNSGNISTDSRNNGNAAVDIIAAENGKVNCTVGNVYASECTAIDAVTSLPTTDGTGYSPEINITSGDMKALWFGIQAESNYGKLIINSGNIENTLDEDKYTYGIYARCNDGNLQTTSGNITDPKCGVYGKTENGTLVINTGDISANDCAALLKTEQSTAYVKLKTGNIDSAYSGINTENAGISYIETENINTKSNSLEMVNSGGISSVITDGNISSIDSTAIVICNQGLTLIEASGSVTTEKSSAIRFDAPDTLSTAGKSNNKALNSNCYLLVKDTISGTNGIDIIDLTGNLHLGAWKIEATKGSMVLGDDSEGTFAKTIQYIVKTEQPKEGGTIYATYADGTELNKFGSTSLSSSGTNEYYEALGDSFDINSDKADSESPYVAFQDETIILNADLEPGYKLVGAYNGLDEKVPLKKNSEGKYYLTIPKGGGVYLTAKIEKETPVEKKYKVTFNANGHGKAPAAQTVVSGKKAKKPADPKASGYTFGGWFTTKNCKKGTEYNWNTPVTKDITLYAKWTEEKIKTVDMLRLYNPNSGEHFYTASAAEKDTLVNAGWKYEGLAWKAPAKSKTPVYRVYNPNAGDHHYTVSASEKDSLVKAGWKDEGIGWYSDDAKTIPVYRAYNPNATTGSHHFTISKTEINNLVKAGWKDEGIAWYGK